MCTLFFLSVFKVDVSGAYESLPHDKLVEVITQVISPIQDEPLNVRRYAKVWMDFHEGLKKTFVRQVLSYSEMFKQCLKLSPFIFNCT